MRNKKKYILVPITVILLLLVGVGYYMYNKPAQDVEHADGKKVTAAVLYEQYSKDTVLAKKDFTQQILQVSGVVTQVSHNQQNNVVILLKTGTNGASVNCTMEGPANGITPGSNVEIKGICNGMGEGDADLGIMGDVYLIRCHTVNDK